MQTMNGTGTLIVYIRVLKGCNTYYKMNDDERVFPQQQSDQKATHTIPLIKHTHTHHQK